MSTAVVKKPLPPFPEEEHWLFGSGYLIKKNPLVQMDFL